MEAWQGTLVGKFLLISNEVPGLNDDVLVARFIKIRCNVAIPKDEQDIEFFEKKLKPELPGIVARFGCFRSRRRRCVDASRCDSASSAPHFSGHVL